jgi:hypothetical protein
MKTLNKEYIRSLQNNVVLSIMIASETEISAFLTKISMPEEKDLRKE